MSFDFERHLGAVERSVTSLERDGQPARAVTLARSYDTSVEDLWDAVTNGERIPRWFAPVEGDLRLGGRYQIKGNAGGTVSECEPPRRLALTWEFGGFTSWVEVELEGEGLEQARLTLTHTQLVSDHWTQYGPGAVGVGWELGLLGLGLHLEEPDARMDDSEFAASPEGKTIMRTSANAWGEAEIEAGEAAGEARARAQRTGDFYTGEQTAS